MISWQPTAGLYVGAGVVGTRVGERVAGAAVTGAVKGSVSLFVGGGTNEQ